MNRNKLILYIVHYLIIINFVVQILYGAYQVFFVLSSGTAGPLLGGSTTMDHEMMVARRLYAIETWIAITGLSIYLAITEINPRMKKIREN